MNEHAIYETVGAKRQRSVFMLCNWAESLIAGCHRPSVTGLRKQYCPEIVGLIECMWAHDPAERPTMSEVVQNLERLIAAYR